MQKNAISSSADPRTRRLLTSRFNLYMQDLYRIQKFWGHMLRHSNPTKNKVWWPRQTKLLVGFGLRFFTGFYWFWWVYTGFGRFSTGCGEAASSKTWFCWLKPFFFAETSSKPGFDSSTRFFRDLVDVGCMMMISNCGKYLSQPSLGTKFHLSI